MSKHSSALSLLPSSQVWNTETLECIATLSGHTGPVRTLVRCGDKIYSGSYDKTVRVWDANSLLCLATLVGHTGAVRALAASDRVVFSGSDDTTIKVSGYELGWLRVAIMLCCRWVGGWWHAELSCEGRLYVVSICTVIADLWQDW